MTKNYRNLGCAVIREALKEYFEVDKYGKKSIIEDLKGDWMDWFTDGLSIVAAQHLESNPRAIQKVLKKFKEED